MSHIIDFFGNSFVKNKIQFTQSAQRVSQRTAKGFCLALRFFALPFSLRPLRELYLSKNSNEKAGP